MHRLQEYFEDSRFEDGHSGASSSFPPPPSGPSSPAATVVSHNPFPYQGTSFSAPSSPSSRSTSLHNVYSDPRSKTYVRYSLDPVSEGESSSSPHRLADRHVRGQVVRKSIKAHKGAGKGKISPPDAGLDNGSAGVGSVLLSMGRGPQDSRKAVVVGNDVLRIVQFTDPADLPPLPPPPHWIPLTFSTSNFAPSPPPTLTSRPATPVLAGPYRSGNNSGNNSRRRSVPGTPKGKPRTPPPELDVEDGEVIGGGPGKIVLREICTLRGLREATGGSGVVETRWGWGGQSSRVFVSGRKGNVMVWDVNSPSKMHSNINVDPTRRPISVMRFGQPKDSSPTAASLVTGGHDSILRLYDFRAPSSNASLSHSLSPALTSPITALAISPSTALHAVVGLENGTIGWVDWRKANRLVNRKFLAHGEGGVMTLDWKSGGRSGGEGWIASGGLDKKVHVWQMDDPTRPLFRTLRCAQPVGEVLWRPGHETEVAVVPYLALSGANAGDEPDEASAIQIWDVRRGYFPKFVLEGGDGAAAGVAWNDHGSLWAGYKTGAVVQHDVRHNTVPLQSVPGTTSTWTADGHLSFSAHRQAEGEVPFDDLISPAKTDSDAGLKSISGDIYDPDQVAAEILVDGKDLAKVAHLAAKYRLWGRDPLALCLKNAQVAADALAWQDHHVWKTLAGMIGNLQNAFQAQANGATITPPAASALHDIPDLQLPPPQGISPTRGRGPTFAGDDRRATSGSRGPSRSTHGLEASVEDSKALRRTDTKESRVLESLEDKFARALAVPLNLSIEDSDLEEAIPSSSDSEDIESSSSSSEDQLQKIPIPRQTRSKRSSFSSRRPSSSSQTRPAFASPLGPHTAISASLPSRQTSPHPNPRSYLRQFQSRPSPPQKARPNGASSDSEDDTPISSSPQLSDDAYGVDPYGTNYGYSSFLSTLSNQTVTKATSGETQPASGHRTTAKPAPPTTKSSPKVVSALSGRRGSVPLIETLPSRIRTRLGSDQPPPPLLTTSVRPPRARQYEQMSLQGLRSSGCRALKSIITEYLDEGNPQMPSLIFIICRDVFPLSRQRADRYVTAYHNLLVRLKFYVPAAKLRKYCDLPTVQDSVRKNTTTYLSCPRHSEQSLPHEDDVPPTSSIAWCLEDKKPAIICCFCSKAVFGALAGCNQCGHGGHWTCMEEWWRTRAEPSTASLEQEVIRRSETPPLLSSTAGTATTPSDSNSPTTPAHYPTTAYQTRSETSGRETYGDAESVAWGWHCPAGCGHLCAVSHLGPSPELLLQSQAQLLSGRSSIK